MGPYKPLRVHAYDLSNRTYQYAGWHIMMSYVIDHMYWGYGLTYGIGVFKAPSCFETKLTNFALEHHQNLKITIATESDFWGLVGPYQL